MADYNSGSVRERIYSGMRGVDFSGDGSVVSPERFSYLENMYRYDYFAYADIHELIR